MALSSVDKITRSTHLAAKAARIVHAIRGWPPTVFKFFPGMRFDPPRAGMMARTLWPTSDLSLLFKVLEHYLGWRRLDHLFDRHHANTRELENLPCDGHF